MSILSILDRPICRSLLVAVPMSGAAFAGEFTGVDKVSGQSVSYRVLSDGSAVKEGDILIGWHERIQQEGIEGSVASEGKGRRAKRAVYQTGRALWPENTVYYEFSAEVERPLWEGMQAAMRHIEDNTGVRFVADASQPYRVIITPVAASVADGVCGTSYIGRQPERLQPQRLTISCEKPMTYLHELMHALGFGHERDRQLPDRVVVGGADPLSVMQGASKNFDTLSAGDIAGINAYYPREWRSRTAGVHPPYRGMEVFSRPEAGEPHAYQLKNRSDNACLSLDSLPSNVRSASFQVVTLQSCASGNAMQQWRYLPDGRIQNHGSRQLCLTVNAAAGSGERSPVVAHTCQVATARWSVGNGQVWIKGRSAHRLHSFAGRVEAGRPVDGPAAGVHWSWLRPAGSGLEFSSPPSPVSPFVEPAVPRPAAVPRPEEPPRHTSTVVEPSTSLQLFSQADHQCLTVRQEAPSLEMRPCDPRRTGQRWQHQSDGKVSSVARPGMCLGKVLASSGSAGSGRGYVQLQSCHASSAMVWRFKGGRLQDQRLPAVGLSNFNGSILVDFVFPQRVSWSQWQWR